MRKIFIADAHLRNEGDENYRLLLEFLAGLKGNTDTLFLLGDLFEFWLGYRHNPFTQYEPLLERLLDLSRNGVRIVYFEGNHDFHMGPFFEERLNASVHPGPAVLTIEGKRVYLCHGDQINRKDCGSRFLRFLFHNRATKALFPLFPPAVAVRIAESLGGKSRRNHPRNNSRWDYGAVLRNFAAGRFEEGCDAVITGHFHLPFLERSGDGRERILLSLGDWITQFSYGEWVNGEISLKQFKS